MNSSAIITVISSFLILASLAAFRPFPDPAERTPKDPKCRDHCDRRTNQHSKMCGEQNNTAKGNDSRVSWYKNSCEINCDGAVQIEEKICKDKDGEAHRRYQDPWDWSNSRSCRKPPCATWQVQD